MCACFRKLDGFGILGTLRSPPQHDFMGKYVCREHFCPTNQLISTYFRSHVTPFLVICLCTAAKKRGKFAKDQTARNVRFALCICPCTGILLISAINEKIENGDGSKANQQRGWRDCSSYNIRWSLRLKF